MGFFKCLPAAATALFLTLTSGLPAQTPKPPRTGRYSIQMFQGKTTWTWISVYPPTAYRDGRPIRIGTPVRIKVYRSLDGGQTYGHAVRVIWGGLGRVGQGARGSREKPWIDLKVDVPVKNQPPYLVYLAVSAEVKGVESHLVASNLTFRYFPRLVRYATRDQASGGSHGGGLAGSWTIVPQGRLVVNQYGGKFVAYLTSSPGASEKLSVRMQGGITVLRNGDLTYTFTHETTAPIMGRQKATGNGRMTLSGNRLRGYFILKFRRGSTRIPLDFRIRGRTLIDLTR